ncbi:MAG: hypothetical protein IT159_06735 [Bryobacterales bacterium]|nr:hypothetical protein [Bryobacterales bacterium]
MKAWLIPWLAPAVGGGGARPRYDMRGGFVEVRGSGKASPSLRATGKTFGAGEAGLGSFFDLGRFRRVRIEGRPAR